MLLKFSHTILPFVHLRRGKVTYECANEMEKKRGTENTKHKFTKIISFSILRKLPSSHSLSESLTSIPHNDYIFLSRICTAQIFVNEISSWFIDLCDMCVIRILSSNIWMADQFERLKMKYLILTCSPFSLSVSLFLSLSIHRRKKKVIWIDIVFWAQVFSAFQTK